MPHQCALVMRVHLLGIVCAHAALHPCVQYPLTHVPLLSPAGPEVGVVGMAAAAAVVATTSKAPPIKGAMVATTTAAAGAVGGNMAGTMARMVEGMVEEDMVVGTGAVVAGAAVVANGSLEIGAVENAKPTTLPLA